MWKAAVQAFFLGMVVPYLALSAAVRLWGQEQGPVPVFDAPAEIGAPEAQIALCIDGTAQQMELEEYLTGVLLAEMPADFQSEALKAQAVAARTFAEKASITGGKHGGSLCGDSGCCQGYLAPEVFLAQGGSEEALERVRQAALETRGQILTYEGELIEATYFACSGGKTEAAVAVWGTDYPYLVCVDSPGEEEAEHYRDQVLYTAEAFQEAIGRQLPGNPRNWFRDLQGTDGGGVESIQIGAVTYSGTQLRSLLGLRSAAFSVTADDEHVLIETKGYGHRVGMSQYGANAMAAAGSDYREILSHYYPGTSLELQEKVAD